MRRLEVVWHPAGLQSKMHIKNARYMRILSFKSRDSYATVIWFSMFESIWMDLRLPMQCLVLIPSKKP